MSGSRFVNPDPQFFDDNGVVLAAGSITSYQTGTSTLQATYYDADLAVGHANANPIVLGADGRASVEIWMDPALVYRFVLKDADGNVIWDRDPVDSGSAAAEIAAHNADPDAHIDATESSRGWTQYATDTEAQAMTLNGRSLTPANLAALLPTTTRPGLVKKTTDAEVEAGTVTDEFVSPATLQAAQATAAEVLAGTDTLHFMGPAAFAANNSAAAPGYFRLPGGITVQWGVAASVPNDSTLTVTFPVAFTTACYVAVACNYNVTPDGNRKANMGTKTYTTTNFVITNDSSATTDAAWVAVGK